MPLKFPLLHAGGGELGCYSRRTMLTRSSETLPFPVLSLMAVFLPLGVAHAADAAIAPASPASLSVEVAAGSWKAADGSTATLPAAKLSISPPEIRKMEITGAVPADFLPRMDSWDTWPSDKGQPGILNLSPARSDHGNTQILGALYRQLVPGSLVLTTEDGSKTFKEGEDYKLNPLWPQVANISGKLGKPGEGKLKASYAIATQRLDLIQLSGGKLGVKRGKSYLVCPVLPEPDAGATAIAGIYVKPWQTGGKHVIEKDDIFLIRKSAPVAPVNPEGVAKTTALLKSGKPVKIAFMGDSVTLGAEAAAWTLNLWTEKNKAYPSRVVAGLRSLFPAAKPEGVLAVQGGTTSKVAPKFFDDTVAPAKPDLLLIAFGLNDANSSIGGKPRVSVDEYRDGLRGVIQKARAAGTEVMLVTPMQPSPFLRSGMGDRIVSYRDAMLALAKEEKVACADVYSAWMKQADLGYPPFSQLHNWINHPGNLGHSVYSETILAFFDAKPDSSDAPPVKPDAGPQTLPQPHAENALWRMKPRELPPVQDVLAKARHNPNLYGLYTWWGEYKARRKAVQEVGWKSIRLGGPLTDEAMTAFAQDGVELMYTFGAGRMDPAKDNEDAFIKDYAAKFRAVVAQYGPGGSFFKANPEIPDRPIIHWEVSNEPNFQYVVSPDGRPNKELEALRERVYSKLLPAAYQAAKSVSGKARVIGFSTGGVSAGDIRFIRNVHGLSPEVAKSYDILATHPYVDPAPPEGFSIKAWGDYSISTGLKTIRQTMAANGRADTPVWYSEMGWEISKQDGGRFEGKRDGAVHPLLQGAYITRNYAQAMRLDVERVHVMFIQDSDKYNGGLFNTNGTWRPSAHAVKNMISLMPAPKLIGVEAEGEDDNYAYRFSPSTEAGAKPLVMAWNLKGPSTLALPFSGERAEVIDMLGGKSSVPAAEGRITVPVGPLPVYIREASGS